MIILNELLDHIDNLDSNMSNVMERIYLALHPEDLAILVDEIGGYSFRHEGRLVNILGDLTLERDTYVIRYNRLDPYTKETELLAVRGEGMNENNQVVFDEDNVALLDTLGMVPLKVHVNLRHEVYQDLLDICGDNIPMTTIFRFAIEDYIQNRKLSV